MLKQVQSLVGELNEVTDNIAHDLRGPMTRIRGIAETTLTGNQDLAAYREMAEAVVEESDRLVGMINTMLEIAQTNSGVVMAIIVSGIGMTEQDLAHIFDRFYRGDRSRPAPGSGLGLSLVRATVRAHGGDITVASCAGNGSTFTVRLPRIR